MLVDLDGSLLGSAGTIVAKSEQGMTTVLAFTDPTGASVAADLIPPAMLLDSNGVALPTPYVINRI